MIRLYRDHATAKRERRSDPSSPAESLRLPTCKYCTESLRNVQHDSDLDAFHPSRQQVFWDAKLDVCDICGWWRISEEVDVSGDYDLSSLSTWAYTSGVLRRVEPTGLKDSLDDLERWLLINPSARFSLNPRRFEELVADVFRNIGRSVVLTSYSGDQGIDLVLLDSPPDALAAVQIKRTRAKIEASAVREFCGALFLRGIVRGVFVTTSDFTRGANLTVELAQARGQYIELWSGARFLDALGCGLRPVYESEHDPDAPFRTLWERRLRFPRFGEDVSRDPLMNTGLRVGAYVY